MEKFQLPPEYDTEKLQELVKLFPQFWRESYFDFDEFKSYVSGIIPDDLQEKYSFTWHGKTESYRLLKKNSHGTLRPCKEDSVNWGSTKNLYLEGDNLEVLKLIKHTYIAEKGVKMIYIDPPYNTGNDFIYDDNFIDSIDTYLEYTNQTDRAIPESSGRYHTKWLNMMYPRLWLANYLLRDDGVIFISIDDNEVHNLRKMCDEVFGEENFVQEIAWRRTDNQANIGQSAKVKEYILVYAKNRQQMIYGKLPLSEAALKEYRYEDVVDGYAVKFRRGILLDKTRGRAFYPVVTKTGKILKGPWMVSEEKFKELENSGQIYWTSGGEEQPYSKIYLKDSTGAIPNDFWGIEYGTNQRGSLEVEALFKKRIFDFPKPASLIKTIIQLGAPNKDALILGRVATMKIQQNMS